MNMIIDIGLAVFFGSLGIGVCAICIAIATMFFKD